MGIALEYFYLHELYHAKQIELRFPRIVPTIRQDEYLTTAGIFNSCVLDLNVDFELKKLGVCCPKKTMDELLESHIEYLEYIVRTGREVDSLVELITLSTKNVFYIMAYPQEDRLNNLLKQFINNNLNLKNISLILANITENGDYRSKIGCKVMMEQIMEQVVRQIGLLSYFKLKSELL